MKKKAEPLPPPFERGQAVRVDLACDLRTGPEPGAAKEATVVAIYPNGQVEVLIGGKRRAVVMAGRILMEEPPNASPE